jgi:hypothetical protein
MRRERLTIYHNNNLKHIEFEENQIKNLLETIDEKRKYI